MNVRLREDAFANAFAPPRAPRLATLGGEETG
jgi:hypothetical protein